MDGTSADRKQKRSKEIPTANLHIPHNCTEVPWQTEPRRKTTKLIKEKMRWSAGRDSPEMGETEMKSPPRREKDEGFYYRGNWKQSERKKYRKFEKIIRILTSNRIRKFKNVTVILYKI